MGGGPKCDIVAQAIVLTIQEVSIGSKIMAK